MSQKTKRGLKIISKNRKAHFNYSFKEIYEAGLVLNGSEVKSLRAGKVSIGDLINYSIENPPTPSNLDEIPAREVRFKGC